MINLFLISVTVSIIILFVIAFTPLLNRRYSIKLRYFVWLMLAVRLIIPIRIEFPFVSLQIPVSNNNSIPESNNGTTKIALDFEYTDTENAPIQFAETETQTQSAKTITPINLKTIIFAVWLLGAVIFLSANLISYIVFKLRTRPYCTYVDKGVYKCARIASPMMIGFFSPKILLPDKNYSNSELEIILEHEMTHFKRHDIWYKLILLIANSIHWFNPIIYLMVNCANRDLEYSCDDIVVNNKSIEFRKKYSMVILNTIGGQKNG